MWFYRRYCLVNDSDANLTPEEAFTVYANQMRARGELPVFCQPRRELVDRLLFDVEVTNQLVTYWEQNWNVDQKSVEFVLLLHNKPIVIEIRACFRKKIHLVFFATPSGLIQFWNRTVDEIVYADPQWVDDNTTNKATASAQQFVSYRISHNPS